MVILTKKGLIQYKATRTKLLTLHNLKSINLEIRDTMYTSNKELVLVTTDPNQDCVYKDINLEQRNSVIEYLQKNYSNVSQYKNISNSRYRYLTMLNYPILLEEPKLVEVRLPC